jgi:hypothetical protein
MNECVYNTDSDEHLINIGEKSQPQMCLIEQLELEQELADSWDVFMDYEPHVEDY